MELSNHCNQCNEKTAWPCAAANDNFPLTVACDALLQRISHERRLGMVYASMELSRRKIPDFVNDVICTYLESGRKIYWPDGREFIYRDEAIECAFGDELSFRYISEWLKRARNGGSKQKPQTRVLDRLRLLDLAIRMKHPARARLIAL